MPTTTQTRFRVPGWWWPAAALALFVALYSLRYALLGERAYVPELAASFRARPWMVLAHTLFGPVALLLGLVNLLPALRQPARWRAHRLVGRGYVGAALVLGLAGLGLAFHAAGGPLSRAGFVALALATLATTVTALWHIRHGAVRAHREWMLRSYALIFGAVTLRIWLPVLIVAHDGAFLPAYRWVAWLSWVPNALWAEWIIRRGWRPRYALAPGFRPADAAEAVPAAGRDAA